MTCPKKVILSDIWCKQAGFFATPIRIYDQLKQSAERSDRTIIVSESLRLLLLDHRRKQLEERLKATNYNDNGFVFAMDDGRPVLLRILIAHTSNRF